MHFPFRFTGEISRGLTAKTCEPFVNRTRARQGRRDMNSLLRFASFLAPGPFILDEELPSADTATTEGRTNPPSTSPLLSSRLQRATGVGRRTMANAIQVPLSVTPEAVLEMVHGMERAHPSHRLVISSPTGDFILDPIHYTFGSLGSRTTPPVHDPRAHTRHIAPTLHKLSTASVAAPLTLTSAY
jgi:hypothetical protein